MMYSLLMVFGIVSFAASTIGRFKTHNKCGCFDYAKCPTSYKPNCAIEDANYGELYMQNSVSSQSPELCRQWFLEGFEKQLTVTENGTLKISLLFSPDLDKSIFLSVQLRYQDQCSDIDNNSSFYQLNKKHSIKYVAVERTSNDSCKKAVEVSFPYTFSGCYQLYINSGRTKSISGGCMSKPFPVNSPYKKTTLNDKKVMHFPIYSVQKQALVFTSVFGKFSQGFKPFSTAVTLKSDVDLSLEDCTGSGNNAGKYILVGEGNCCHALDKEDRRDLMECPCEWDGDDSLRCIFREIKIGNYCVILQFIDPRCEDTSLWTEGVPCVWSFVIEAKGNITVLETRPYEVNNGSSMVILYCTFVVFVTAAIVFTLHYFQKEKGKKRTYAVENVVEKSLFISEEEEIVLLYPRDCERFMTAMALFRVLLKESCGCKVHDAWDEEVFDKVAESIETWSLPLIQNTNTKIIVILSECSKIIEESYIGAYNFATYRDPKAFDKIFAQSIKALNEYFATRSDSYRRVFVVRVDEAPVIDFSFHFNRATVYILPHALQTLVDDLHNGNSTPLNKESLLQLKEAIHEYQVYRQQNKNYLNDILNINNNCKVMKCIKNGTMR